MIPHNIFLSFQGHLHFIQHYFPPFYHLYHTMESSSLSPYQQPYRIVYNSIKFHYAKLILKTLTNRLLPHRITNLSHYLSSLFCNNTLIPWWIMSGSEKFVKKMDRYSGDRCSFHWTCIEYKPININISYKNRKKWVAFRFSWPITITDFTRVAVLLM